MITNESETRLRFHGSIANCHYPVLFVSYIQGESLILEQRLTFLNGIYKKVSYKSFSVSNFSNGSYLKFDLDLDFQVHSEVKFNFSNGNPCFYSGNEKSEQLYV